MSNTREKPWLQEDPDIKIDVEALMEYMEARWKEDPNAVIPYGALAHVISKPTVQDGRGRYCLTKARRLMRDQRKMLVVCVRDTGIRWVGNDGVNRCLGGRIKRSRNQARTLIRESGTFKQDEATPEQKTRFLASQNLAGAIIAFSSRKAVGRVEDAMKATPVRMNTERVLEMFRPKTKNE